jgi:phosphatidylserine decarboxylase
MKRRPLVAREGWGIIAFFAAVTLIAGIVHLLLGVALSALLLLSIWFFRDPDRPIPADGGLVVAPADGRVMWVRAEDEPRFLKGRAVTVSIFLSVFDVHINRSPIEGRVAYKEYVPGQFVAAWDEKVGEINERSYIGLEHGDARVLVSQVAGLVARRILTWPVVGDHLQRGERFGLIRFGSCTQVWLPTGSTVQVKAGDRVKGGETIIGRLPM